VKALQKAAVWRVTQLSSKNHGKEVEYLQYSHSFMGVTVSEIRAKQQRYMIAR